MSVSVIIPYFQREHGILKRAVDSALRQDFKDFDIIIVDDGSPVPAADEISVNGRVKVIRQKNAGAGMARNTAIDAIPDSTSYIAFLDSDDEWEPQHLSTALSVLQRRCDCYFSNLYNLDQKISKFEKEQSTNYPGKLRPEEMRAIDGLPDCYEFTGDMLDRSLFSGNLIMPSTLVYSVAKFGHLRMKPDYRRYGDEILFFCDLACAGAKFGFSARPLVKRGHGINVYDKAGWGTTGFLQRLNDQQKLYKYARSAYSLTEKQLAACRRILRQNRREYIRGAIRMPLWWLRSHI